RGTRNLRMPRPWCLTAEGAARLKPTHCNGWAWVLPPATPDPLLGLDLDPHVGLVGHLQQVFDLVAVLLGDLVHAGVLMRLAAVLHADLADGGLAVGDLAGHGDDQAPL